MAICAGQLGHLVRAPHSGHSAILCDSLCECGLVYQTVKKPLDLTRHCGTPRGGQWVVAIGNQRVLTLPRDRVDSILQVLQVPSNNPRFPLD